jgi:hypothetical protein
LWLTVSNLLHRKEKWPPVRGAIRLAASLRSPVMVMVMVEVMEVMRSVRLCTRNRANRERNSGNGGQSESKFSHEYHS